MTTDELIVQMAALLKHGDNWQARAFGRDFFAKGQTPREAMERALGLEKVADDHWVHKLISGRAGATLPQTVTPVPIEVHDNSDLF